jgi:hypothetical protein
MIVADSALLVVALILGIAGLVAFILVIAHWVEKKRTETLELTAGHLGLSFSPKEGGELMAELAGFQLFRSGHGRKLSNVIAGDTGELQLAIFDYQYTTGSGKSQHTHKQTVAAVRSARLHLPTFYLRPETVFDRIGSVLGMQDIDFETHPAFSSKYVLKAEDEAAVRQRFTPAVLAFLESQSGITVEGGGDRLILFQAGKRCKPDQIRDWMQRAYEFFGAFVDTAP